LNNAPWELKFTQDRSFTIIPYSIRDSAVCYYYEPAVIEAGDSFTCSISLTAEDIVTYDPNNVPDVPVPDMSVAAATGNNNNSVLQELYRMKETLEQFIAGDIILYEEDLDEIEDSIDSHKSRQ